MIKKRFLITLITFAFLFILTLGFVLSQATPSVPNTTSLKINPNTGLPESFEQYKKVAQNLSDEEKREDYLKQEWTKLLANNPILGPILYHTNNFFTIFNPFWKIIFGLEFSWSWLFIISFVLWVSLIIIFYVPFKEMTDFNPILTLVGAVVLASLMGSTKVIPNATQVIYKMTGLEYLGLKISYTLTAILTIVLIIIFVSAYQIIMHNYGEKMKKESEEEKLKRAQEVIKATGKLHEKELK